LTQPPEQSSEQTRHNDDDNDLEQQDAERIAEVFFETARQSSDRGGSCDRRLWPGIEFRPQRED
jgi:hypothetical protein